MLIREAEITYRQHFFEDFFVIKIDGEKIGWTNDNVKNHFINICKKFFPPRFAEILRQLTVQELLIPIVTTRGVIIKDKTLNVEMEKYIQGFTYDDPDTNTTFVFLPINRQPSVKEFKITLVHELYHFYFYYYRNKLVPTYTKIGKKFYTELFRNISEYYDVAANKINVNRYANEFVKIVLKSENGTSSAKEMIDIFLLKTLPLFEDFSQDLIKNGADKNVTKKLITMLEQSAEIMFNNTADVTYSLESFLTNCWNAYKKILGFTPETFPIQEFFILSECVCIIQSNKINEGIRMLEQLPVPKKKS